MVWFCFPFLPNYSLIAFPKLIVLSCNTVYSSHPCWFLLVLFFLHSVLQLTNSCCLLVFLPNIFSALALRSLYLSITSVVLLCLLLVFVSFTFPKFPNLGDPHKLFHEMINFACFSLDLVFEVFWVFFYIRCQTLGFKFRLCISINFEVFVLFFCSLNLSVNGFCLFWFFVLFVWVLVLDWTKFFASVRRCWEWFRLVLFLLKFWYSNDGCIFSLYFFSSKWRPKREYIVYKYLFLFCFTVVFACCCSCSVFWT